MNDDVVRRTAGLAGEIAGLPGVAGVSVSVAWSDGSFTTLSSNATPALLGVISVAADRVAGELRGESRESRITARHGQGAN